MPTWETILQRLDYVLVALFAICLCLDIVRTIKLGSAAIFLIAVYWADVWGLVLYSVFAQSKFKMSRLFHIVARLKTLAVALIAPCLELHDTLVAIKAYHQFLADSANKAPKAMLQDILQIFKMIHADPTVVCWGPFESLMETLTSKVVNESANVGLIHSYCGQLQARTILMLITGVVVLVEMLLYWRLSLAESEWVRSHLRMGGNLNKAQSDKDQDIEMGENSSQERL